MAERNPKNELNCYRSNIKYIEEKRKKIEELSESINRVKKIIEEAKKIDKVNKANKENERKGIDGAAKDDRYYRRYILADERSKIANIKAVHIDLLVKTEQLKQKVDGGIAQIKEPYSRLLFLHYIQGESILSISHELQYDYEYCRSLKIKGIDLYLKSVQKNNFENNKRLCKKEQSKC